jgi:AcrR family transcriptional regulator
MKDTVGTLGRRRLGRPRESGADERILEATLQQLADEGYARMSLDAVATAAGSTKPTIYRRWPSKEALAVAAIAHLQTREQPKPTGATLEDLCTLLRDFQKKLLRPNGMAMLGMLLAEEHHTPRLIALFRERIVNPRRQGLLRILRKAKARGELRSDVDLNAVVNMLVGSYYARYLSGEQIPPDWPRRIVDVVMTGARCPQKRHRR